MTRGEEESTTRGEEELMTEKKKSWQLEEEKSQKPEEKNQWLEEKSQQAEEKYYKRQKRSGSFWQRRRIPVLDHLEQKNISLVPNLRVQPIGVPSKVMMTMTTSMTAYAPPQCSHN